MINMIKYKIYTESILKSKTPLDKEQILASAFEQGFITDKVDKWNYKIIVKKKRGD